MSRRKQRKPLSSFAHRLEVLATRLREGLRDFRSKVRYRRGIQVEVLVSDERARRSLETEVQRTLRRLERVLGNPFPDRGHLAIVVQGVIRTDRQLAGCYQLGEWADGTRFALVRVALRVNGRKLDLDEVLAALAEQWISLAIQQSQKPSVLVPLDLEPPEASPSAKPPSALRPDPLSPHSNGQRPAPRPVPGGVSHP
jgi:hypothetical protein